MKFSAVVLALAMLSGASAYTGTRQFMEQDAQGLGKAQQWRQGARATSSDSIKLQFWLRHNATEIAAFEEELLELATPGTKSYAQWMSREEVTAALSPAPQSIDAVAAFALDHGASDVHVNKMRSIVSVTVPANVAEEMLATELYHYQNTEYKGVSIVRANQAYSLPVEIAEHVSIVGDIIRFPRLRNKLQIEEASPDGAETGDEWSTCGSKYSAYTNPAVLASTYGFDFPFKGATKGNSIAVAEFQNQYYDNADLEAFSTQCGLDSTVTVTTTIGGNNEDKCTGFGLQPCVESLLDIEYAGAIAGDIPLSVYYSGTFSLLDWAETLLDQDDAELVHSVSYGNDEAQQDSADYMESVNTQFMKAGAQGLTIMFAAGDQGVWGREGVGKTYHPDFPAGSPYVTAVGGTDFSTKSTIGEETAWGSGGSGFSDEFAQPDWQSSQVEGYFNSGVDLPADNMYNAAGRGYPDVSALAGSVNPYFISFKGGKFSAVAGTSAACPVVAGIVAQLNDARLAAGKPALGWMNPFLYSADTNSYNDVTTGTTDGGKSSGGFTATKGWDPATGFGTVQFANLKAAALAAAN